MKCPERGCREGVLYWGPGPEHEKQTTGCPTCRGTGHVPDVGSRQPSMGSPGCLGTVLGGLVIAVVAVLALVAVGIALLLFDPRSPFRDEDPDLSEVSAAADDAARGLTIGSCVDDPFGDEQIIVGDCAVPHGAEAFRILRVEPEESDDYPGGGELQDFGGEHCEPYFQDLSVVRTWTGTLKFTTAYSSEAEWAAGDRYLVCLLVAGVREPLPPGQVVLG